MTKQKDLNCKLIWMKCNLKGSESACHNVVCFVCDVERFRWQFTRPLPYQKSYDPAKPFFAYAVCTKCCVTKYHLFK